MQMLIENSVKDLEYIIIIKKNDGNIAITYNFFYCTSRKWQNKNVITPVGVISHSKVKKHPLALCTHLFYTLSESYEFAAALK